MKVDLENWQVKQLREYFGHNDKTQIAHWAYTVFDKAHKKQLILSGVSKSVVCGDCDGYGYTVDENGRRKEHCNECE